MLLGLTFLTCLFAGYGWDLQFRLAASGRGDFPAEWLQNPLIILRGAPYALALMFILFSHEMGHYLTCRHYRINCTPPMPIPCPSWPFDFQSFGTLGAFIRIKSPFLNRRQLFDVGIMGPLAGMVAAVPIFIAGLALSKVTRIESHGLFIVYGDSFLTYLGFKGFFPAGTSNVVALHPLGWAAFFGFLATSLNLLPIGQLDGGHIVYAIFGRDLHRIISRVCFVGLVGVSLLSLRYFSPGYMPFALVLFLLKLRHPPTLADDEGVTGIRLLLALLAGVILCLTFIPVPVSVENF